MMVHFMSTNSKSKQQKIKRDSHQSVDIVMDEWDKQKDIAKRSSKPEVDRILKLHNLIKKQTILVFIAILSTICLWIGAAINIWIIMIASLIYC